MSEFTYVAVHNGGSYVISFNVHATAEGQPWFVESGNYGSGDTHTVQVPIDAIGIILDVRGEKFIDDWKSITKPTWDDTSTWPSGGLSYSTSGVATSMHCHENTSSTTTGAVAQ
jgi:hypothetical protein